MVSMDVPADRPTAVPAGPAMMRPTGVLSLGSGG
jgi:hypothetical protein